MLDCMGSRAKKHCPEPPERTHAACVSPANDAKQRLSKRNLDIQYTKAACATGPASPALEEDTDQGAAAEVASHPPPERLLHDPAALGSIPVRSE